MDFNNIKNAAGNVLNWAIKRRWKIPDSAYAIGKSRAVHRDRFIWVEYDLMKEAKFNARKIVMKLFQNEHPHVKCYSMFNIDHIRKLSKLERVIGRYKAYYRYKLAWKKGSCWSNEKGPEGEKILRRHLILNYIFAFRRWLKP
jgi:hypothetical protein